jgi:hypothetical protein
MNRKRLAGLVSLVMTASMLGTAAIAAVVDPGTPRQGRLVEVGPISPETGFPTWYRDSNGIRLEACYTLEDPLCSALPDEIPNPEAPISFPDNFPGEFFYQMASAELPTSAGPDVLVVMDLEAAFAQEEAREGDQMVFGRVRIRAKDVPDGQTWRVTHPYGIDQFTTSGGDGINMTEDIGTTPQAFGEAFRSRIGPFLRWDPDVAPAAPAGYVGDPSIEHEVIGSPYGTNFVLVERQEPDGTWTTIGETRQFSIQGRLATNSGLDVQSATYSTDSRGNGFLDVLASSESGQVIQVPASSDLGTPTITLRGDGGRYFARIALPNPPPDGATLTVRNVSDKPATTKTVNVVDQVSIDSAVYDADARTLTVEATSSDLARLPALSVGQLGAMAGGVGTFSSVEVPPAVVTVTSAGGGSAQREVRITGAAFTAEAPVAAFDGPDSAQVGQSVTFDAAPSLGDVTSYAWTVTAPDGSTTTGSARTIEVNPSAVGSYSIELVVSGPGGTSEPMTGTIVVSEVQDATADAGADQTVVRGTLVRLDGSASRGAATYSWRQVSGPTVTLNGADTAKPTFTYPLMPLPTSTAASGNPGYVVDNAPIVLELTTAGVNGVQATDRITVNPRPESITGIDARYRTRGEWRVSGTSSILAGQRVAIVLGAGATGRVIGTVNVDAAGAFSLRNSAAAPGNVTTITIVSATGGVASATLRVTS